jgi:hypothetical protein
MILHEKSPVTLFQGTTPPGADEDVRFDGNRPAGVQSSSRPAVSTAATLEAARENNLINPDDTLWAGMSRVRELENQLQVFMVSPLHVMMRMILTKNRTSLMNGWR